MKRIFWLAIAFAAAAAAGAEDGARDDKAPSLTDRAGLILYGAGEYSNLGESIYLAGLYVGLNDFTVEPGKAGRMEMRITAQSLSARRFARFWLDAITLSSSREERAAHADDIQAFADMFKENLLRGDRVHIDYLPSVGQTQVTVDGVKVGDFTGEAFYRMLLNAWIGDSPLSASLKEGVLNELGESAQADIRERFQALGYAPERRQAIEGFYRDVIAAREAERERLERERMAAEARERELAEQQRREAARLEAERLAAEEEEKRRAAEARLAEQRRIEDEKRQAKERIRFLARQEELSTQYRKGVIRWLSQNLEYPTRAYQRQEEGRVELTLVVDRRGKVVDQEVTASSGNSMLDTAALRMIDRSGSLPVVPEELEGETFTIVMPVLFTLEG